MVFFFSLKEKLQTEYKSTSSICPSYLIMKTVFSEGLLANNEEKKKRDQRKEGKGSYCVESETTISLEEVSK